MMRAVEYDPYALEDGWCNVTAFVQEAQLIAWDGCHKIYLAMDEAEAKYFRTYYEHVIESSAPVMYDMLSMWFEKSCSLRFISAVYNNPDDRNAGFLSLIAQFAVDELEPT